MNHYLAIAEFYGRVLVEDLNDPRIPEFVLVQAARRTARFGLNALRLAESMPPRRPQSRPGGSVLSCQ